MKRYDNIQLLRVLACLGVFAAHLAPKMGARGAVARAANFGASGVYLFFLVSAFLACGTWSKRRLSDAPGYYLRRALRILPLYYGVILYQFLLHTLLLKDVPDDPAGLSWLRYLFLTNAFLPGPDNFWSNLSATWTISLFLVFYLCVPFLVRAVEPGRGGRETPGGRKAPGERKTPGKREIQDEKKGGGSAEKGLVLRAALLYLASILLQQLWNRSEYAGYMMCFYYLHFFVLGILVWYLVRLAGRWKAAAVLAGVCAAAALLLLLFFEGVPYFTGVSWLYAFVLLLSVDFSWEWAERLDGAGRKMVECVWKGIALLDRHSYAIYLVHAVVIEGLVLVTAHVPLGPVAVGVAAVGLTAAGVAAADRLIERPAARLMKRWTAGNVPAGRQCEKQV